MAVATAVFSAIPTVLGRMNSGVFAPGPVIVAGTPAPRDTGATMTARSSWTDSRCDGCHRIEPELSHPIGVVPRDAVPDHLPLEGGRVTCVTCHDDSSAAAHASARARGSDLLRLSGSSANRCGECHREDGGSAGSMHARAIRVAHLTRPSAGTGPAASMAAAFEDSSGCLECHDGTVAPDAANHRVLTDFRPEADHPVGVRYQPAPHRRAGESPLRPQSSLDSRIRLFQGQVGCGSCHSVYSSEPTRLVMSNSRSQLCLSCHVY